MSPVPTIRLMRASSELEAAGDRGWGETQTADDRHPTCILQAHTNLNTSATFPLSLLYPAAPGDWINQAGIGAEGRFAPKVVNFQALLLRSKCAYTIGTCVLESHCWLWESLRLRFL